MHTKFLAISAAIFLMSSSVSALGNPEDFAGGLAQSATDSDLVYPELALLSGQVGGLKRRNVHELTNGPRYGFPATEKKATFRGDKRGVLSLFGKDKDEAAAPEKQSTSASQNSAQAPKSSTPSPSPQGTPKGDENSPDREHPDQFDEGDDEYRGASAKRSIVGTLFEKQASPAKTTGGDDEEGNDDEGGDEGGREAKRELKAIRRRKVRRDLDSALFKGKMGVGMTLHEGEKLVGDTQGDLDKTVEILGNTGTGVVTSLTKNGSQSKASDSGPPPSSASDEKSETDDTTKNAPKDATKQPKAATAETSKNDTKGSTGSAGSAPNEPQAPVNEPSPENTKLPDNVKVNPEYLASSNGGDRVDSGSNYNGQYFA
ncbi:hypothetical protein BCR42DRAFT_423504 [Absidia repens]|uniref:Uncharacterized protein n=1 Tax=Absidia repens TaxID=90262 RepID=A0A1X2I6G5_9FUNG|nr:hypothetical protein BCR42DRAFT_423504 [Absidia repens]